MRVMAVGSIALSFGVMMLFWFFPVVMDVPSDTESLVAGLMAVCTVAIISAIAVAAGWIVTTIKGQDSPEDEEV